MTQTRQERTDAAPDPAGEVLGQHRVGNLPAAHACVTLAEAPPASRFTGFDIDDASMARARRMALAAGVAERVSFEVAAAADISGGPAPPRQELGSALVVQRIMKSLVHPLVGPAPSRWQAVRS
jgi:hypothetical protein